MKAFRKFSAVLLVAALCAGIPSACCCNNSITDLRRRAAKQEEQEPLDPEFSYGEDAAFCSRNLF